MNTTPAREHGLTRRAAHSPLLLIFASLAVGWAALEVAREWRWSTDSDAGVWFSFGLTAAALLLPLLVTAFFWRRVGRGARVAALLVCGFWAVAEGHQARNLGRDFRVWAPNLPVAQELLRAPRAAMRVPPEVAAERALAAGDTSFLATGGTCGGANGVDSAVAAAVGVRVIRGTYHDGAALTAEHAAFMEDASGYAWSYNDAVATRLGIERVPPGADLRRCYDPTALRRGAQLFWP